LSFKPHTDDIREAPALYNIDEFLKAGATVKVHDPEAMPNVKNLYGDKLQYFDSAYDCAENADAIFIATEWPEFRTPDFEKLTSILKNKVIFDGRNVYELDVMKEQGFKYFSIGREVVNG
jgi:UDPglucose 6-dehydrogenase